jgi:hypothetical protein
MNENNSCALKASQMINTPTRKRNTRFSTKSIRKPRPRRYFNLINNKLCFRKSAIENYIISMFQVVANQIKLRTRPSSFTLNKSSNSMK